MKYFLFAGVVVLLRSIYNLITSYFTVRWIKTHKKSGTKPSYVVNTKLYVLLPVLCEQQTLNETLEYYKKILESFRFAHFCIITTEKEDVVAGFLTTKQLAEEIIKETGYERFFIVHYPKIIGSMPDQVNYAIEWIDKNIGEDKWFLTINIDSRYDGAAFSFMSTILASKETKMYQFSTLFINNFNKLKGPGEFVLKAGAIYQSRWTVTHEIKRLLLNSSNTRWSQFQFAHTVGHGLLAADSVMRSNKIPEDKIIEDTPFGFLLRSKGIIIHPVPFLELGDSPASVSGYLKQKYMWSFGPLGIFSYVKSFLLEKNRSIYYKIRILLLGVQGLVNAVNWQVSSWIFLLCFFGILIVKENSARIFLCVSLFLYSLDFVRSAIFFNKESSLAIKIKDAVPLYFGLWVIVLTHSFPANYALVRLFFEKIGFASIKKIKTEHV